MGNTKVISVTGWGQVIAQDMQAAARAEYIALTADAEGYLGYQPGPWFVAALHSHSMVAVAGLEKYLAEHCEEFILSVLDVDTWEMLTLERCGPQTRWTQWTSDS